MGKYTVISGMGKGWQWIVFAIGLGVIYAVVAPNLHFDHGTGWRAETKQNLHSIQLAIERYYQDRGHYPESMKPLRAEGYLPKLPRNPYERADDPDKREMKGIDPASTNWLGNFSYIPLLVEGRPQRYLLLLYGGEPKELKKGDPAYKHIIMCLTSEFYEDQFTVGERKAREALKIKADGRT